MWGSIYFRCISAVLWIAAGVAATAPGQSNDHGNNAASATVIAGDSLPVAGALETEQDLDFFRLSALAGSSYVFSILPAAGEPEMTALGLTLHDSNGVDIITRNFALLSADTLESIYWICPSTGDYFLSVQSREPVFSPVAYELTATAFGEGFGPALIDPAIQGVWMAEIDSGNSLFNNVQLSLQGSELRFYFELAGGSSTVSVAYEGTFQTFPDARPRRIQMIFNTLQVTGSDAFPDPEDFFQVTEGVYSVSGEDLVFCFSDPLAVLDNSGSPQFAEFCMDDSIANWFRTQEFTLPLMSVSPRTINAYAVAPGQSRTMTIRVTNSGTALLQGEATTTAPFSISGASTYAINPGESADITVLFNPVVPGAYEEDVLLSGGGGAAVRAFGELVTLRGTATGTVTTGGVPVDCAAVRLSQDTGAEDALDLISSTDENGRYLFDTLAPGTYLLEVFARGLAPQSRTISVANESETETDFGLAVESASTYIAGVISERLGINTLGGVRVSVYLSNILLGRTFSCSSGDYQVSFEPGGGKQLPTSVLVVYEARGYLPVSETVSITSGQPLLFDPALTADPSFGSTGGLVVNVRDAMDIPVAGASVTASFGTTRMQSATGSNGNALFQSMPPGLYTVSARRAGLGEVSGSATVFSTVQPIGLNLILPGGTAPPPVDSTGCGAAQGAGNAGEFFLIAAIVLLVLSLSARRRRGCS